MAKTNSIPIYEPFPFTFMEVAVLDLFPNFVRVKIYVFELAESNYNKINVG